MCIECELLPSWLSIINFKKWHPDTRQFSFWIFWVQSENSDIWNIWITWAIYTEAAMIIVLWYIAL